MANNYSNWTIDKLNKEIEKIQKIIKARETKDKKEALAKVKALARKNGFELHELVKGEGAKKADKPVRAAAKTTKKRGKVPPKYRNPADADVTWTGRGRQPVWVREFVQGGGKLEDITING